MSIDMAKALDHLLEQMTAMRRATIEARAGELPTLKDLPQRKSLTTACVPSVPSASDK